MIVQKLDYPTDFAARVCEEFPMLQGVLISLRDGRVDLGRYLDDLQRFDIEPSAIVRLFEQGNEREVLAAARQALRRRALYAEWGRLFNAALNKEE